jgi:hypothetical protein
MDADKKLTLAIYCSCGQHLRGNKDKPASIIECGSCHQQFTVPESTQGLTITTSRKFSRRLNVGLPDRLFDKES